MTDTAGHDWITFHRLRFPEPVSALKRTFPSVAGTDCWLFGPHYDVGPDGMLTGVSDTWGGVGIWHSRDAAEVSGHRGHRYVARVRPRAGVEVRTELVLVAAGDGHVASAALFLNDRAPASDETLARLVLAAVRLVPTP